MRNKRVLAFTIVCGPVLISALVSLREVFPPIRSLDLQSLLLYAIVDISAFSGWRESSLVC